MFPAWILFHILFSIYILAYSLQKYKSRTVVFKYLHIGAFAAACLCATSAIISIVNHVSASKMILWSSFFFGFNATIGLFFIPFVHKEWVVWKRLLTIGAWFNIAAVFTCWFLIFPSMTSLLFFRISMGILLISVVAELRIAFFLSTSPPPPRNLLLAGLRPRLQINGCSLSITFISCFVLASCLGKDLIMTFASSEAASWSPYTSSSVGSKPMWQPSKLFLSIQGTSLLL